jgi:hypothetical protein
LAWPWTGAGARAHDQLFLRALALARIIGKTERTIKRRKNGIMSHLTIRKNTYKSELLQLVVAVFLKYQHSILILDVGFFQPPICFPFISGQDDVRTK